ncbi:hypothetical protein AAFC00_005654 [Neodothiora populina]|uniref:Carrier domain-containing protein n=1 Tax=Neodothiora populina TaxID=2781224 RepID=A0ABR3PLM4_9PEZI
MFEVQGLPSSQITFPTGMREDVVLLSWVIVLLRSREDSDISFDWAYDTRKDPLVPQSTNKRRLAMKDVIVNLQSPVKDTLAAISSYLAASRQEQIEADSGTISIILSTSTLSQTSDKVEEVGVLHLELRLVNGYIAIRPLWHTVDVLLAAVTRYIRTLADTAKMCISNPEASIEDSLRPTAYDMAEIWQWNHTLPTAYSFCMHEKISGLAQRLADREAISSWDGTLTYAQVDQYSTFLADTLVTTGVQPHEIVPVCFEKSRWTIVVVLAVMKAGATFVLMDPTLPLGRLQNMAGQVDAKLIVASRQQQGLSKAIHPDGLLIVVEEETFTHIPQPYSSKNLQSVPPSTLMYIIFTSGSTGTPKGVKISHETYTSSAIPRAKAVGYADNSRVLDFASYAFDVSIDSMLLTLGNGGCLCIPSDEARLNDINEAMRRMGVTYAGLTPSVARILSPDVIKSLDGLGLGGEAVSARDVAMWGRDTRIIIGYGPCECTIGCTVNSSAATGRRYISIGTGNGAAMWVVDPNDHNVLMPVGAVGELLVEGPIVGQGYLNDADKTAAAFIEDPPWLLSGYKHFSGRQGRLYKTGDLGRYDPDGSGGIIFVGRKDTQVKLRGQRVELGEIESQLKAILPSDINVIAEVIVPQSSAGQPILVVFVASDSTEAPQDTDLILVQPEPGLRERLTRAKHAIAEVLPRYMVPTAYVSVNWIPVLISGKTDRKRLREFGVKVDLRQLDEGDSGPSSGDLTDSETRLRDAWAEILKLDAEAIGQNDNFFALGGDSLAAMRLVSVCRVQGLTLTVINTFGSPTLSGMASTVQFNRPEEQCEIREFSMISRDLESLSLEASIACGTRPTAIEDIYSCTPTQESLFTFSLKSTKPYVAQRIALIPLSIELNSWKSAWDRVVVSSPILRTRLAQLQEPGLQQVVLKDTIAWRYSNDLQLYLEQDRSERMDLGQSLARYAIVTDESSGNRYMIWTIHHVLYDGWSEPLVLQKVSDALQGKCIESGVQMRDFVRFVHDIGESATQDFWRTELNGAVGPQFPRLPSRDYLPQPDSTIERSVDLAVASGSPFTIATLIRGAWALVASQYTGNDDVVFGETLTGRDIELPGVEGIIGPLIATVPVRIRIYRTRSVESYLAAIQQSMLARTPYQHLGMQYIRKVSQDAQYACEAGTGLVIQPEPDYEGSELGFETGDVVREALHFNPYPVMLAFGLRKGGVRIRANFDSSLVGIAQMERVLAQLEKACEQLTRNLTASVNELSCLPEAELNQIWQWNHTPPLALEVSSERLRTNTNIMQGSVYPRAVVPWVCDARDATRLSPIGCIGELWLESTFFPAGTGVTPIWLTTGTVAHAGRAGVVSPTGDLVRLQDDGSLVFVGRKDKVIPVHGHAVDTAELEKYFSRSLPPNTLATAAIRQPVSDNKHRTLEPELVVFIEMQHSHQQRVKLLSKDHTISMEAGTSATEITIHGEISIELAIAVKKVDKSIKDALPSYMLPSAYVIVDKIPVGVDIDDHTLLNDLASTIPQDTMLELHAGFQDTWSKALARVNLTSSESILLSAWATILGMKPEQIDVDDNFFRLGGDSVLAMKLTSSLRRQGHVLTVANIFQHMRLRDAAKVLKVDHVAKEEVHRYEPFSTLGPVDRESFLSEIVRPRLADPYWAIQDVCRATDSQVIDVRQTIRAPKTSVQYTMQYFGRGIDRESLMRACDQLISTHDILRTVFIQHENDLLQVVLTELEAPLAVIDAPEDFEEHVSILYEADIESDLALGSPFLQFIFVEGDDDQNCLILRLSHAQYDGESLPRLLRDLETLYQGHRVSEFESYPSYIARCGRGPATDAALKYWRTLLHGSSISTMAGTSVDSTDRGIFLEKPVNISGRPQEITIANLLTAAWALLLARRLKSSDVTFGNITSGRQIGSTAVHDVMGPTYQFTPVRVSFESQWTGDDLLDFVQTQSSESAAHDFVGFTKIAKECTQWSAETQFFDSVVHHQDVEDFDTMPFAGTTCRVEISNPHGDSPQPFKVVSFVRNGQTRVGVVGNENNKAFVEQALQDLAATIEELATHRSKPLILWS